MPIQAPSPAVPRQRRQQPNDEASSAAATSRFSKTRPNGNFSKNPTRRSFIQRYLCEIVHFSADFHGFCPLHLSQSGSGTCRPSTTFARKKTFSNLVGLICSLNPNSTAIEHILTFHSLIQSSSLSSSFFVVIFFIVIFFIVIFIVFILLFFIVIFFLSFIVYWIIPNQHGPHFDLRSPSAGIGLKHTNCQTFNTYGTMQSSP